MWSGAQTRRETSRQKDRLSLPVSLGFRGPWCIPSELTSSIHWRGGLRGSHRVCCNRLFGLDAPAPVGHRLDQLADLLACALVMQVYVLVEESGGPWHQHLRVGYYDGTNATKHPTQGSLCIC